MDATEARAARLKGVQSITGDRAKDILKARKREKDALEKWTREFILVELRNEHGMEITGCSWKVQRKKLTREYLQSLLDRKCPIKDLYLDCVRDAATQEVIWPEDMSTKCLAHNIYVLIPRWPDYPVDQAKDPRYQGDYGLALMEVPLWCDSERYEVKLDDVRTWVDYAILEEDRLGKLLKKKLAELEEEMKVTVKDMSKVSKLELAGFRGDAQDVERERRYQELEGLRSEQGEEIEMIKKKLRWHLAKRKDVKMEMHQSRVDRRAGVCNWYIRFLDRGGEELLGDLLKKFDWGGIRLAVGHKEIPPWAGRGDIPNGDKGVLIDHTPYSVCMRAVKVARMFHGFGTLMVTPLPGTAVSGTMLEHHHGLWEAGTKQGLGLNYSDQGIFIGPYDDGVCSGIGRLEAATGDLLEGNYSCQLTRKPSRLRTNPFAKGVPHGENFSINFSDGSTYRGSMVDGKVTGQGKYVSSLGEVYEGQFKNGVLHGTGRSMSAFDETFEGEWEDGRLHGDGTWKGSRGQRYQGSFHRGLKQGRGVEKYINGNFYKGYYKGNYRCGRGEMFYGHVEESMNEETGETSVRYDCRMECDWIAGYMRAGGLNYYIKSKNSFYTFNRKSSWYPFVSKLKDSEDRHAKTINQHRKRQSFIYELVRNRIEDEKIKAYKDSRKRAAQLIKKTASKKLDVKAEMERLAKDREEHTNMGFRKGWIQRGEEKEFQLTLASKIQELEQAAKGLQYPTIHPTDLTLLLQSLFEGCEERWKVLSTNATLETFMRKGAEQADALTL